MTIEEAFKSLNTDLFGLSDREVKKRLSEFGPNEVKKISRGSWIIRLGKEFFSFFSIILWFAAGLALIGEWTDPGQGMAKVALMVIAVIIISGLFSFWQEYRAEQTLAALMKLLPSKVKVIREGTMKSEPLPNLVPGDILILEQGDHVPADCRLIEAFGVRINTATITGESLPQFRSAEPSEQTDLFQANNILLAGTAMMSGEAKAVVFATGMHTEFGKIAQLTQSSRAGESPLRLEISHLSRTIALLAVFMGLTFFGIGWAIGVPLWDDFIFAIGLIVAMVPEGLLPTLTLALVLATQRMAKRNVLIRYLPAVEAQGSTTVICTDKTGTLTQNRMSVKRMLLGDAQTIIDAKTLPPDILQNYPGFFLAADLCHDLKPSKEAGITALAGDPMEIALVQMVEEHGAKSAPYIKIDELPFDADRMRLTTVHALKDKHIVVSKGAPETLLPLCTQILSGGSFRALKAEHAATIQSSQETMAEQGLRVLALAYKPLIDPLKKEDLEQNLIFCGLVGLQDPPRPEVPDAIRRCHEAGIRVIMVTGDHPSTAKAIAREIGLITSTHPSVIKGDDLRHLTAIQLGLALDATELIFARVSADQKMRIVEALKQKRHIVAVTGDGVNDGPALKAAHIGIAMGITGTDVAKESADMVLLDDNFASIVNAIEEGRAVFENIRKFLCYILTHNVAELIPYLGFVLFRIPLALTPVQILAIDMGTDSLTALGLGTEQPAPELMQQKPRSRDERLFNGSLAWRAYGFLGLIEAAAAMLVFFWSLDRSGWHYGQTILSLDPLYREATTACLSTIIVMQIINVFLCRSSIKSAFKQRISSNRLILWGVILEAVILVLIVYTPMGHTVFNTVPLDQQTWIFMLPFALALLILEELRKWLARNFAK